MIYNKSTHPVEVKKISIRLWSLRDEIEAAIARRMKECEAAGVALYIDDIKQFYNIQNPMDEQSNVVELPNANKEDNINSLMESIGEESTPESTPPSPEEAGPPETNSASESESSVEANSNLDQAEEIMAQQKSEGLNEQIPNPILNRPYKRQPPDLDKISYGFSLLSDINMDLFLAFTKDHFLQGQSVMVEFLIPQNFMMSAEVIYSNHYARTSRIISSLKPDYRVQCKFSFQAPDERENLRNFLKSIQPTITEVKKKPKKASEDDSLGF